MLNIQGFTKASALLKYYNLSMYVLYYCYSFINFGSSPDRVEYDLVRLLFEAFSLSDFIVNIMEGETVKTGYTWSHFLQSLCDT